MAYIDKQIRKLPYSIHRELARFLDPPGESDWHALIAAMPSDTYSIPQVNHFERLANMPNGSPTMQILNDMGQKCKTVRQLVSYLERIQNEEAMLLLRPHEPVVIVEQPVPVAEYTGRMAVLMCRATGFPSPRYQWFKDNQPIDHAVDHELRLENLGFSDTGIYKCRISNRINTVDTEEVIVDVRPPDGQVLGEFIPNQTASAKVALVIGNRDYMDVGAGDQPLQHTINDSRDLATILQGPLLQFKVISLRNLTKAETLKAIDIFCEMLDEEAYALFYFAGHGFQCDGVPYMVPVDAQSEWAKRDCVPLDHLLKRVNEKHPKFCLCILDMCRKKQTGKDADIQLESSFWPMELNLTLAYATCPHSEAYEKKRDSNGLYMKHLKNHIEDRCKVEDVLLNVQQDVRAEVGNDKQTSMMRPSFTSQNECTISLVDPIEPPLSPKADIHRDEVYINTHTIPRPKVIVFEEGISVEIGFLLFPGITNLMFIYVHVVDMGPAVYCDALLNLPVAKSLAENFPQTEKECNIQEPVQQYFDMPVNVLPRSGPFSAPERMPQKSLPFHRKTPLLNIQRLKSDLSIMVKLDFLLTPQGPKQTRYRPGTFSLREFGLSAMFTDVPRHYGGEHNIQNYP